MERGFSTYWKGLVRDDNRYSFEVALAQIRWAIEHLMQSSLPDDEQKRALRAQWEGIFVKAAHSLATQFPFLDPNTVQGARDDHIGLCARNAEVPLREVMPMNY